MNKLNIRKTIISVIAILALGFLTQKIGSSFDSGKDKPKPKVTIVKLALVQKITVANKSITPKLKTEGKLGSSETISVSIEGKGTLKSNIDLKEGGTFKVGQRIAYVEDNQAQANFKASLYKYHQILTNALIDIKLEYPSEYVNWNDFTLAIQNGKLTSLPTVTNSKLNNYLSAKGIYNTYYDLKSVQTSLGKRSFSAPFNGYISTVSIQNGSFINGTTRICEISPKGKLELTFSLNENFAKQVSKGTLISVITGTGKTLKAKVNRVSNQVNSITQQRDFTAQLVDKSNLILAGDFVQAEIPLASSPTKAMILPSYCIKDNELYVIKKDSTLSTKSISIIGTQNDSLIVAGLNNNDVLLLESYSNFSEGQKVRYK